VLHTPKGSRTPVSALRGRCPGPLDDGGLVRALATRGGTDVEYSRVTEGVNPLPHKEMRFLPGALACKGRFRHYGGGGRRHPAKILKYRKHPHTIDARSRVRRFT
jgi:hypothetical protein